MKRNQNISWPELAADKCSSYPFNYVSHKSFYVGDYIHHKSFGLGYIQNSFGNKIEVIFEDKVRTLKHMVMF